MNISFLPKELLNIILEYDGRIKYRRGKYINVIHQDDERYSITSPIIIKKNIILKTIELKVDNGFYFEFSFDKLSHLGLCYDYNFSYVNALEICYYDIKPNVWKQIRTIL